MQNEELAAEAPGTWSPEAEAHRWMAVDWWLFAIVMAICAFWIALRFRSADTPAEDASMLLRYADNLARGAGIRWNIGDRPVDGATDFLFVVAVGLVSRLTHAGVIAVCRALVLTAHVASVALVFVGGRKLLGTSRWLCAAMAAYLCAGPATKMAVAGFAAPCLAFFVLCCWCGALWYAEHPRAARALPLAVFGLIAGLTRPEGVLITCILVIGLMVLIGIRRTLPAVALTAIVFLLLGGPYFLWHWHYFGYPLPNPFYIKGNGHFYTDSVRHAAVNLAVMLAPVVPLIPLGWTQKKTARLTSALVSILACFTLMWILLNNWNNGFMRFQYSIVPLALMTVPGLLNGFLRSNSVAGWNQWRAPLRLAGAVSGVLAVITTMSYFDREFFSPNLAFGMREFALRLQPMASHGDSIAVTEAGALPLFSRWRAIDGLGLNDSFVAHHHGRITEAYLDAQHPDVIMVHVDSAPPPDQFRAMLFGGPPTPGSPWENFERMTYFAKTRGYTLAGALGESPCNLHVYWVRPGWADSAAFLHQLHDFPYYFLDNGGLSHDYRDELPPRGCYGS